MQAKVTEERWLEIVNLIQPPKLEKNTDNNSKVVNITTELPQREVENMIKPKNKDHICYFLRVMRVTFSKWIYVHESRHSKGILSYRSC